MLYFDESANETSLSHGEAEELANKKLYGKSEIMNYVANLQVGPTATEIITANDILENETSFGTKRI